MSGATRGQPRLTTFAVLVAISVLRERRSDYLSRARRTENDGWFAALSFAAKVPRSLVQELFAVGTPDEVIEQIAEFRDHGLRYLVVGNAGAIQPSLRESASATTPYVKVVRGLRKL